MSFGVSVGDIMTMFKLVADINSCLQNSGGARAEYQELVHQLEVLQKALTYIESNAHRRSHSELVEQIRYAIWNCQKPLQQFFERTKRYEKWLGGIGRLKRAKATVAKLQWTFSARKEVEYLLQSIQGHVQVLNILLADHNTQRLYVIEDKADGHPNSIYKEIYILSLY
jgi:hypothetical protein